METFFSAHEASVLNRAIDLIHEGITTRIDLGQGTAVYKVPSMNPTQYTIRIDIKVREEEWS